MKTILLLCVLMFAPMVAEGQATNDKSRASLEEHLKSLVRQWDEAIVKRDAATLDRLLADEFEFVGGVKKGRVFELGQNPSGRRGDFSSKYGPPGTRL